MKLGIVVVYLASEENERLLDLHLNQIEKYTKVPYTIYGSANRLLPQFLHKLQQHPEVKICECPTTDLRGAEEHSFYLEHLVKEAIEDGASHIVTLHVDSFPIRSGWVEELANKLSNSCMLATVTFGAYTACLFFQRGFYLKYHPTLLLSETERLSEKYMQFRQGFEHLLHSGIGYCFKAYSEGFTCSLLKETNKSNARYGFFSKIYDDIIFHLGSAAYSENDESPKNAVALRKSSFPPLLQRGQEAIRFIIPKSIRQWACRRLWITIHRIFLELIFRYTRKLQKVVDIISLIIPKKAMGWVWNQFVIPIFSKPVFEFARKQLLEDPESYFNYLRTGKR